MSNALELRSVGIVPLPQSDPVADWMRWMNRMERTGEMSELSVRVYKNIMKNFQKWCSEQQEADGQRILDLKDDLFRVWVGDLRAKGNKVTTRKLALCGVRNFFRWCIREGLIDKDPTLEVKPGKMPSAKHRARLPLTDEQITALVSLEPLLLRDKAMIWTLLATAIRTGELLRLNIDDVKEKPDGYWLSIRGKARDDSVFEQVVIAFPDARDAMREYLAQENRT